MTPEEAIEAFYINGGWTVRGLTDDVIRSLPISFLLRNINFGSDWPYLPQEIVRNERIALHEPCYTHYNTSDQFDHMDGPPPSIAKCVFCIHECTKL
jgi:hypothetical protein